MSGRSTALFLSALLFACGREPTPPPVPAAPPCPGSYRSDPDRAQAILSLLRQTEEGTSLLARKGAPLTLCFGDINVSSITDDHLFLLRQDVTDPMLAARLGHLLLHSVEGMPMAGLDDPGLDCDALVDDALRKEAKAHALELELRSTLGASAKEAAFPFEKQFWEAPRSKRVEVVHGFFRSHPQGAKNVIGFAGAYQERCRQVIQARNKASEGPTPPPPPSTPPPPATADGTPAPPQ